jgi:hypothetical protein
MSFSDLSPVGHAELARLEAELPRLEAELARAEARYAEDRPRYEAQRREYPKVRDEEIPPSGASGASGSGSSGPKLRSRTYEERGHLRERRSPSMTERFEASSEFSEGADGESATIARRAGA